MAVKAPEPKQRQLTFGSSRTISTTRAAKMLDCSPKKVIRLIEMGLITGYRAYEGAWWQVEYESLVTFLNRMVTEPPQ